MTQATFCHMAAFDWLKSSLIGSTVLYIQCGYHDIPYFRFTFTEHILKGEKNKERKRSKVKVRKGERNN